MRTLATILTALGCAAGLAAGVADAQDAAIAGVWRSQVEGTPSGLVPGVSSSDVQTLTLTGAGQYRREIVVEGGNGVEGAGGVIVDSGLYSFAAPATFQYSRRSWIVCVANMCNPGQPIGANSGTLPFSLTGPGTANFLGLNWTKIQ
ncbi:MAG TPA: hypothetical protein VKS78_13015 [Roseiarcus sp.]|nr:hypothetical protein [Roseiarcus sp.]